MSHVLYDICHVEHTVCIAYHKHMTIIQVFNRYGDKFAKDRTIQDRVVSRIGRQPARNPVDAVLLMLAMDEIDGIDTASTALDGLLRHMEVIGIGK